MKLVLVLVRCVLRLVPQLTRTAITIECATVAICAVAKAKRVNVLHRRLDPVGIS